MSRAILYGAPGPDLIGSPAGAVQVSPIIPGSEDLALIPDASVDAATVLAPGGALERDYVLAQALRVLKPGAPLTALAPKDKGGSRLRKGLEAFGCAVSEEARRHHRFCHAVRPAAPNGLDAAIAAGQPRLVPDLGLWSQPGVFSWDRADPGSLLLLQHLPALAGEGADLGCGVGLLSQRVLGFPKLKALTCLDIDRRAVLCAAHNLDDPRVTIRWADARAVDDLEGLDFVVMNPPFHDGGAEDRALGQAFIRAASSALRKGGTLWLTANRHLPYEAVLNEVFKVVKPVADDGGFKVYEARR